MANGNLESRGDFETACKSRFTTQLETTVLQRLAIADNLKLQEDIKDIAAGYLDILLEQVNTRKTIKPIKKDTSLENRLKHEHWQRIEAHMADWHNQSSARIAAHTNSMDQYVSYLKEKWRDNIQYIDHINGMIPGSDELRREAAHRIIGGIVKCLLDAIDPQRATRCYPKLEKDEFFQGAYVNENFDPVERYSSLSYTQKEIVEFLRSQASQEYSPIKMR